MKLIGWGDVRMTARERPFAAEPSQLRKVLVRVFFARSRFRRGWTVHGWRIDETLVVVEEDEGGPVSKLTLMLTVVVSQAQWIRI